MGRTTTPTRGPRRVARTHQAIERALAGTKELGHVAVLVAETLTESTAIVLTRGELAEHLQRVQAHTLDAPGQRVIADIETAVAATPRRQTPVLIATREGRAILQAVEAA